MSIPYQFIQTQQELEQWASKLQDRKPKLLALDIEGESIHIVMVCTVVYFK